MKLKKPVGSADNRMLRMMRTVDGKIAGVLATGKMIFRVGSFPKPAGQTFHHEAGIRDQR